MTTVTVPEQYVRKTELLSIEYQLDMPLKVLSDDPNRIWASVVGNSTATNCWVSTNPLAHIGDPDVCAFYAGQGAVFFETYGTNDLYLIGPPIGTDLAISTCVRKQPATPQLSCEQRSTTRIITDCGGGPVTFASGFAPLLAADPTRRRAHVKVDAATGFAALCNGVDAANFMPVAPFFPGYAVVEGTQALAFANYATGPTSAWWIRDREVTT